MKTPLIGAELTTQKKDFPKVQLTLIELASCCYLIFPLLFFMTFYPLYITIPLDLFILWQLGILIRKTNFNIKPTCSNVIIALFLALLFASLIGIIPGSHIQPTADWMKHDAVLNDLSYCTWPPRFDGMQLRYYLGYYLIPAALSAGVQELNYILLYGWTVIGLTIVFLAIAPYTSTRFFLFILAFIFFSGFDLFGGLLTNWLVGNRVHAGLDWWSNNVGMQYVSIMNLLLWVPQHALPAWILTTLFFNKKTSSIILSNAGLLFSATLLWSIFVPVGAFPYFLLRAVQQRTLFIFKNGLTTIVVGGPVLIYLLTNSAAIPMEMSWSLPNFTVLNYFIFMLVEVGIWIIWLLLVQKSAYYDKSLIILLTIILSLIPFLHIGAGAGNDFVLRASIPSLTILAMFICHVLVMKPNRWPILFVTLSLLVIASISPLMEVKEAISSQNKNEKWQVLLRESPYQITTTDFIGTHAEVQLFASIPFLKDSPSCKRKLDSNTRAQVISTTG